MTNNNNINNNIYYPTNAIRRKMEKPFDDVDKCRKCISIET